MATAYRIDRIYRGNQDLASSSESKHTPMEIGNVTF